MDGTNRGAARGGAPGATIRVRHDEERDMLVVRSVHVWKRPTPRSCREATVARLGVWLALVQEGW